jgi:N-acetylmuramic acid 6-phosphate etherase
VSKDSPWEALPTEAIHPKAGRLDTQSAAATLATMAKEDERVARAVHAESRAIQRAAALMAKALAKGGRTLYVGAGTSGRLGVLEAAECPPTYGTEPSQIVGIMAGGDRAVFRSKEGIEDRERAGEQAVRARRPKREDLVVGISASSVTPFVRGALAVARERDAATVLVTCGPRVRGIADVVVAPQVGPEVLAGSTRMKAGTATKLVLNQMTLLAMIRLKKVFGPHMVEVQPTSAKLRDRAVRMVESLARVERHVAETLLASASQDVKTAVVMGRLDISAKQARRRLDEAGRDLRRALSR